MSKIFEKNWDHSKWEEELYNQWEKTGYFKPEINLTEDKAAKGDKPELEGKSEEISNLKPRAYSLKLKASGKLKPFVISMPPPNVTGKLHMGHALTMTLEDIMVRYHRLKGEPTLWLPGTDHAGIATQTVVDKALRKEGINKNELGREKFVEKVWEWREKYGGIITNQIRRLGSSCDWSRERFTLDEGLSHAVRKAFVDLYSKDLIYRGERVVNWCPKCHTAIADDEVEYKEENGKLYWLKYGPFILATARPETKLGDTAVAVHPGDKRYQDMVGKHYKIPGVLGEFEVVVVADNAVDPKFGSGAIKVTPAHSFVDYEIAQRHKVPMKQIIDENGRMMANTGKYVGMKTAEAREAIVADMQEMGLMDHIDDNYLHNLATCYRCGGVIEPIPSKQWFVKMKPLAIKAKKIVESGDIKIIPSRFEKVYFHWMDNIHDWCISRQLWWGHQIPVWYKQIPRLIDLPEFLKNKSEVSAGETGSPVQEKPVTEYRFVVEPADMSWIKANINFTEEYQYIDFFDGERRTRIKGDVYTVTNKKAPASGVVTKSGRSGLYQGIKACLEERTTTGFARYEVEFKGSIPEYFKDRQTIASTEILNHQNLDSEGVSIFVGLEAPEGQGWVRDSDVLDTWFSSALWPFSTLGWPEYASSQNEVSLLHLQESNQNKIPDQVGNDKEKVECERPLPYAPGITACDYQLFYPTTVMETGYDILFFWVARMVMFGLEFTGKAPFETVYLHGLVRDEQNRKMSKSLGNVLDPLDLIPKYGTDALRMALVVGSSPGQDIPIGEGKIKGYRNFSNKIWNASRYVALRVSEGDLKTGQIGDYKLDSIEIAKPLLTEADKSILVEHEKVKEEVDKLVAEFRFSLAGEKLYDYFWHTFADIYIEQSKSQLSDSSNQPSEQSNNDLSLNTKKILVKVLSETLTMLHPFMPYVTEAVWQDLRKIYSPLKESIMISSWPVD